jgi:hypothetical protein
VKRIIAIAAGVAAILIMNREGFAISYDTYSWGDDRNEVYEVLYTDGKALLQDTDTIMYTDELYGKTCAFTFYFTSETKELFKVQLVWEYLKDIAVKDFGSQIKEVLIKTYDTPDLSEKDGTYFKWVDDFDESWAVLDYSGDSVVLTYGFAQEVAVEKEDIGQEKEDDRYNF